MGEREKGNRQPGEGNRQVSREEQEEKRRMGEREKGNRQPGEGNRQVSREEQEEKGRMGEREKRQMDEWRIRNKRQSKILNINR
ncbi:MAG: hypothetical protein LBL13_03735 [Bacteroidales bacterium]|jgi:hypothetical protein|nr:hypothetical protein [Bacteroidales bacterium]